MDEDQDNQFESWAKTIDSTDTDLCRALWLSVAIQAVIDARSKSGKKRNRKARAKALEWLSAPEGEDSDFAFVCELAGLDFHETRKRFKAAIHDESDLLDFRCLKKFRAIKKSKAAKIATKDSSSEMRILFPNRASMVDSCTIVDLHGGGLPYQLGHHL